MFLPHFIENIFPSELTLVGILEIVYGRKHTFVVILKNVTQRNFGKNEHIFWIFE